MTVLEPEAQNMYLKQCSGEKKSAPVTWSREWGEPKIKEEPQWTASKAINFTGTWQLSR